MSADLILQVEFVRLSYSYGSLLNKVSHLSIHHLPQCNQCLQSQESQESKEAYQLPVTSDTQ